MSRILNCLAICSRNDMIASQILDNSDGDTKNLAYICDIINEQFSMIKWNQEDIVRADLVNDACLLENCIRVIQQMLVSNKVEVLKQQPDLEQIISSILSSITDRLKQKLEKDKAIDFKDVSVKARQGIFRLI